MNNLNGWQVFFIEFVTIFFSNFISECAYLGSLTYFNEFLNLRNTLIHVTHLFCIVFDALLFSKLFKFECCGSHGYNDWMNTTIPSSCCKTFDVLSTCQSYYQEGCADKLSTTVLYISIAISVVAICNIVFHVKN